MKVGVLLATALAVGSSSIAASAASDRPAPNGPVAKAEPAAKKPAATQKEKTERTAARKSAAAKGGKGRVKVAISKAGVKTLSAPDGIDTMATASIGRPAPRGAYSEIVTRYASAYGVPASLADAVMRVESNYRPDARGSAGEIGLMQIKPATARMLGYSGSTKGLFNPETNIKYGLKYLAMAHKLGGGTTCGTILRYNAGHAATRMNPVSAAYCSKVKRHLGG